MPAYSFAMIHNGLDEKDAAVHALERSVAGREVQATFIRIDTRWDALRVDLRVVTLLKRVGLDHCRADRCGRTQSHGRCYYG